MILQSKPLFNNAIDADGIPPAEPEFPPPTEPAWQDDELSILEAAIAATIWKQINQPKGDLNK